MRLSLFVVFCFLTGLALGFQNCAPANNNEKTSTGATDQDPTYGVVVDSDDAMLKKIDEFEALDNAPVPLPPSRVQFRIVAKGNGISTNSGDYLGVVDLCGTLQKPVLIDLARGLPRGLRSIESAIAAYRVVGPINTRVDSRRPLVCSYEFQAAPGPNNIARCQSREDFVEGGNEWVRVRGGAYLRNVKNLIVPGNTVFMRTMSAETGEMSRACVFKTAL